MKEQHYKHVKRDLIFVHSEPTGIMGMGNKGGVGIHFRFHDSNLCFMNVHLPPDPDAVEQRNSNYIQISKKAAQYLYTDEPE